MMDIAFNQKNFNFYRSLSQ